MTLLWSQSDQHGIILVQIVVSKLLRSLFRVMSLEVANFHFRVMAATMLQSLLRTMVLGSTHTEVGQLSFSSQSSKRAAKLWHQIHELCMCLVFVLGKSAAGSHM